jgi:hypothetical protein
VLEVGERRPQPAEELWQRPRHAHFLRPGAEPDRFHSVRDELRAARDCRKAEVSAADRREQPQQVLDVRLVPGPLPAEDVGVDDDQRLYPTASS